MEELKVKATSQPKKVAGAIAGFIRNNKEVEVVGVGAAAVNQAVKAIIIATSYLSAEGVFISTTPAFKEVKFEEGIKTAIKFIIKE